MSASRLRLGMVVWITGQSGSGKTTLAHNLKDTYLPAAIILDGDEMRATISTGADFSKESRIDHNLRVARLAGSLADQGHVVIVPNGLRVFVVRHMFGGEHRPTKGRQPAG